MFADGGREITMGVHTGADSRAAQGDLGELFPGESDPFSSTFHLACVPFEHLSQTDRGSVLKVGSAGLDHPPEFLGLAGQGRGEPLDTGLEPFVDREECGQMQRGGDDVVGGLALIDMVVGVDQIPGAASATEDFRRPVGDDLVGVHVRRGSRAGLENVDDELVVEPAVGDLPGRLPDRLPQTGVELAQIFVGLRRAPCDPAQRPDHSRRDRSAAHGKVQDRPLSGRPVIGLRCHFHLAHGILFDPRVC